LRGWKFIHTETCNYPDKTQQKQQCTHTHTQPYSHTHSQTLTNTRPNTHAHTYGRKLAAQQVHFKFVSLCSERKAEGKLGAKVGEAGLEKRAVEYGRAWQSVLLLLLLLAWKINNFSIKINTECVLVVVVSFFSRAQLRWAVWG